MAKKQIKSLTLDELIKYNQEIVFPFMDETFIGKKEFRKFENDMISFKDEILKGLEDIKQEKTIGDEQDKRQKKVLEIHNNALKKNKILSDTEALEVSKLRVF